SDGTVECWGRELDPTMNDATTIGDLFTPRVLDGVNGATALSPSYYFSCVLLGDHSIRCLGANGYGQLGDGTTMDSQIALVMASGLSDAIGLATGQYHSCALLSGGTVKCWGWDNSGQLGEGQLGLQQDGGPEGCGTSYRCARTPTDVPGLSGVAAIF